MKLYGYWRSQATYRVRVAMNLKGIPPEDNEALDLAKGDQFNEAYRKVNPLSVVPALVDGNGPPLIQSMAIMEFLEETRPTPPLLPKDPRDRARVRALAMIPVAEIHPLMVPRVRNYVEKTLKLGEAVRVEWVRHWVGIGLGAMETLLNSDSRTGKFWASRGVGKGVRVASGGMGVGGTSGVGVNSGVAEAIGVGVLGRPMVHCNA